MVKVSSIPKICAMPALICTVPRPKDVVTPKTVVKIAITSIKIAKGLLDETLSPSSELTLKAVFYYMKQMQNIVLKKNKQPIHEDPNED